MSVLVMRIMDVGMHVFHGFVDVLMPPSCRASSRRRTVCADAARGKSSWSFSAVRSSWSPAKLPQALTMAVAENYQVLDLIGGCSRNSNLRPAD